MIIFIYIYDPERSKKFRQITRNIVRDMNKLATRILKNRKHMEQSLSEKVPYVEVIMAEKSMPPDIGSSGSSIIGMIRFRQSHVTLRQSFYYESDGRYFKYTDEFFAPFEILPKHIFEKLLQFDGEVDITEEINLELSGLNTIAATETD